MNDYDLPTATPLPEYSYLARKVTDRQHVSMMMSGIDKKLRFHNGCNHKLLSRYVLTKTAEYIQNGYQLLDDKRNDRGLIAIRDCSF